MRYPCSGLTVSYLQIGSFCSSGTVVLPHENIQNLHRLCPPAAARKFLSLQRYLSTLDTVLREHGTNKAMFRSLNPKFFNLRIFLVPDHNLDLFKMNLRFTAHTFILVGARWWFTLTGQAAQNVPDNSPKYLRYNV